MHQTANFQLNQWEATDRLLREDFNTDNAKIEAAILSRLGPVEVIAQMTLTTATESDSAALDLSGVDWGQWSLVAAELRARFSTSVQNDFLYLEFPGLSFVGQTADHFARRSPGPELVVLFPGRDSGRLVSAAALPGGDFAMSTSVYEDIQSVRLAHSNSGLFRYLSGSGSLTVYGIR